jgi:hypothetical protein
MRTERLRSHDRSMTPLRIRRRLAVLLLAAAPVLALIPSSANALIPNDQYEYWVDRR